MKRFSKAQVDDINSLLTVAAKVGSASAPIPPSLRFSIPVITKNKASGSPSMPDSDTAERYGPKHTNHSCPPDSLDLIRVWRHDVIDGVTFLGYTDWVASKG